MNNLARIDDILLLSRENVQTGKIMDLYRRVKRPDYDEKFLTSLNEMRLLLTREIYEKNTNLEKAQLIAQKILDRFILVRFAEYRGFITYEKTLSLYEQYLEDNLIDPLLENIKVFWRRFDKIYNSAIFQYDSEVDEINIDNEIICNIIKRLYEVSFRNLSPFVLGTTYELYLGTTIIKENNELKIVECTASKKAGGVFYTPRFITKYMVYKSLEPYFALLNEKIESYIEEQKYDEARRVAEKIFDVKVCDPSCGSGTFLIETLFAIQRFCEDFNRKMKLTIDTKAKELIKDSIDVYASFLSNADKKYSLLDINNRILNNILFGVDLDPQAVDIAAVGLVMAGMEKDTRLPLILNQGIKNGNSLISSKRTDDISIELKNKKPFDWKLEFPYVFRDNGFDILIGNPPYVCSRNEEISKEEFEYFKNNYYVSQYQVDLYVLFIERTLQLSKNIVCFIIPDAFLANKYTKKLRELLLKETLIEEIVITPKDTFASDVDTIILRCVKKSLQSKNHKIIISKINKESEIEILHKINQKRLEQNTNYVFDILATDEDYTKIIDKMTENSITLGEICEVGRGVGAYHKNKHSQEQMSNKVYHSTYQKDKEYLPELRGRDIHRYGYTWAGNNWIKYGDWLNEPRQPKFFKGNRLIFRKILDKTLVGTSIEENFIANQVVYICLPRNPKFQPKYILAILNSKFMGIYYKKKFHQEGRFPHLTLDNFRSLPIRDTSEQKQNKIIGLVDEILVIKQLLNLFLSDLNLCFSKYKKSSLGSYINYPYSDSYSINNDASYVIDEKKEGIISEVSTEIKDDRVILWISLTNSDEDYEKIRVLELVVNETRIRDFFFINFYIQSGKKTFRTKKDILEFILNKIEVFRFVPNNQINATNIKETMDRFYSNFYRKLKKIIEKYGMNEYTQFDSNDIVKLREYFSLDNLFKISSKLEKLIEEEIREIYEIYY